MAAQGGWIFVVCLNSYLFVLPVVDSYRGGIIQWRPTTPTLSDGKVELTHRIAWRRDSPQGGTCTNDTIENEDVLGSGELVCRSGCSGTVGSMSYLCTDFSVNDNWSTGERTYEFDFGSALNFEASYSDSGFITIIGFTVSWELRVKGNLTRRSDTGLINTSPVSSILPFIRLQSGCDHIIRIPVEDADGDYVRCRIAESSLGECSQICSRLLPASLDESTCELHYQSAGGTGIFSMAIQIEDFASPTGTVALSSVPLQFVVSIFESEHPCTNRPQFISPTRLDGSCVGVPFNSTLHEQIVLQSSSEELRVVEIVTSSPPGLRKSQLVTSSNADGILKSYVNLTWTPAALQYGPNILCFSALTAESLMAPQRCITLLGGVEAPVPLPDSVSPSGELFSSPKDWSITFDRFFVRPSRSRFIRIFEQGVGEVLSIDVANSTRVTYPTNATTVLRFDVDLEFSDGSTYYVLLDPGVAVGTEFCNVESPAITDRSVWTFTVGVHVCVDGDVRLVGGSDVNEGRVEVCYNNEWGTICNKMWDEVDAGVVCGQLGFSKSGAITSGGYGGGTGYFLDDVDCSGREDSIFKCPHSPIGTHVCSRFRDAGVICKNCSDGEVRLIGGNEPTFNEGRVEICMEGTWGTVCDKSFESNDAEAVCKQLGYPELDHALPVGGGFYGSGSGTIYNVDCTVNETTSDCSSIPTNDTTGCTHTNDVGVVCIVCSDYDIRLVGGSMPSEGRVEVCFNNEWGTVCPSRRLYTQIDSIAGVACRQTGFSRKGAIDTRSFGLGSGLILLNDVRCYGDEDSVFNCSHQIINYSTRPCAIGVICRDCTDGEVSLVGGSTPNEGRVEVCMDKTWGTVCDKSFGERDAVAVCKQLGYTELDSFIIASGGNYGSGGGLIFNINCTEISTDCIYKPINDTSGCTHSNDAGIACIVCSNGDVRLAGGPVPNRGRVEVCYNSRWSRVCNDLWDNLNAQVVCRQAGFSRSDASAQGFWNPYGAGSGPVLLTEVQCSGKEDRLFNCSHRGISVMYTCALSYYAAVWCRNCSEGEVSLVGGNKTNEGRVEICKDRTWGTVCDKSFDMNDAEVVCEQLLGSSELALIIVRKGSSYGSGSGLIFEIECSEDGRNTTDCSYESVGNISNCTHSNDAGVICILCFDGDIRLVNGSLPTEGRVEVCYNNEWGTICDDFWDNVDAGVVCRQLGFSQSDATARSHAFFGQGSGPILLDNVHCSRYHASVFDCFHSTIGFHNCHHSDDAGIVCRYCADGEISLVGSNRHKLNEGRVEICKNRTWGTVCDKSFATEEAATVCKQLGYAKIDPVIVDSATYGSGTGLMFDVDCNEDSSSTTDCTYTPVSDLSSCTHSNDVGVVCKVCVNGDIRLVGGSIPSEGRVEVCFNEEWGTVCDDMALWDDLNARVVCRQLGLTASITLALSDAEFGLGSGPILLDDVVCSGDEARLIDCFYRNNTYYSCINGHLNDVGVICRNCTDGEVRLVGGNKVHEGRVEICVSNAWATVCDGVFQVYDAEVVCNQLGYIRFDPVIVKGAVYGSGDGLILDIECPNKSRNIRDCHYESVSDTFNCTHSNDAGLVCKVCINGDVRLIGGSQSSEGRVEVCYDNEWGTVCDEFWGAEDAGVVCRRAGFSRSGAIPQRRGVFGRGSGRIWLDNVRCLGFEDNLLMCVHRGVGIHNCNHYQDVGVTCKNCTDGDINLVRGSKPNEGRVEICVNETWGTVCDSTFGRSDAENICHQLGYPELDHVLIMDGAFYGSGSGHIFSLDCTNDENTATCDHNPVSDSSSCTHSNDVGLACIVCVDGDIRLVNGSLPSEGRVEVCHDNEWGTVCDDSWDDLDAEVVCRQAGFSVTVASARRELYFSKGSGPILLDEVKCYGNESNLFNCTHQRIGAHDCSHYQDAGVICRNCTDGEFRLVGGSRANEGRVEICMDNAWGTVCDSFFGVNDAAVICNRLGYSKFGPIVLGSAFYGSGSGLIFDVDCIEDGRNRTSCSFKPVGDASNCSHSHDAGVNCTVCLDGDTRLVGGSVPSEGFVEVCYNKKWGTICPNSWDNQDASVICRQLGFSRSGAVAELDPIIERGINRFMFNNIQCSGFEDSVLNCSSRSSYCSRSRVARAVCKQCNNGDINLVGAGKLNEGRVEICIDQTWGTVCDNTFDAKDAEVVCEQLGFPELARVLVVGGAFYGSGGGLIYDISCNTSGNTTDCEYKPASNISDCSHANDAGVVCTVCFDYDIRLVGGSIAGEGRIELCYNNEWGTVCDDDWDVIEARIVCKQFGFSEGTAQSGAFFGQGSGPVLLDNLQCSGQEDNLFNCSHRGIGSHSCGHHEDAGVTCRNCTDGEVRLVRGNKPNEGRVEICMDETWGTVCDNTLDINDAGVICNHLGYSQLDPVIVHGSSYGSGSGLIFEIDCIEDARNIKECSYRPVDDTSNCTHVNDAGIMCIVCVDGDVRLVGGSVPSEGRVEVCSFEAWGTVCDTRWENVDAMVVCRQAGYSQSNAIARRRSYFGRGTGSVLLDRVQCNGNEANLFNCHHLNRINFQCRYHNKDAGVTCQNCTDGVISLTGGKRRNEGRVEICINGIWGTVCDKFFDQQDAEVLCNQLGHSNLAQVVAVGSAFFGAGIGVIFDLNCSQARDHQNCTFEPVNDISGCKHSNDAGVMCIACLDGDVRLVDGSAPYEGHVEVCYNNRWGRVCDHLWDNIDAQVVCRQAGYPKSVAFALSKSFFGAGSGYIILDDVTCTGNETKLVNCSHRGIGTHNCDRYNIAGVLCESCTHGEARLVGGPNATYGRVETCVDGKYGSVCDRAWDDTDAQVICTQLGYSVEAAFAIPNAFYGESTRPILFNNVECSGAETSVLECVYSSDTSDCSHSNDAGVQCIECYDGRIRLTGGSADKEGRIELCHNQQWGTVCDNGWNDIGANVVCRQAGFSGFGAVAVQNAAFGQGLGEILLDAVSCFGRENSIFDCSHGGIGRHNCGHSEDAGVICEYCMDGELRLIGGTNFTNGRVEVCFGRIWGTVCDDAFDSLDAGVLCEQLGLSRYNAISIMGAYYGQGSGMIHVSNLQCSGLESNILECNYDQPISLTCNHSNDVSIQCRPPDNIPPILRFHNAPSLSNENITINWTFSEEATSFCILQTPATLTPTACSNNSIVLTNLHGGYYSLYVQGTDVFNNTAPPVRISWTVDLIPPTMELTSFPSAVSHQTEWLFRFQCIREVQCTFRCSLHVVGDLAQFEDCSDGQWLAAELQNNVQYELSLIATDAVGNIGQLLTYKWTVDTEAPTLSVLSDVTVSCDDDISPAAIGIPAASDNEDSDPVVSHVDNPGEVCSVRRVWSATDNAGNNASFTQTITITNPLPPRILTPSEIVIPCGSVEEAFQNAVQANLTIVHPCDRPVTVTFADSAQIDQCGFTLTRTWIVMDDCGTSSNLQQTVRVLDLQLPDSPVNGQVNTKLNEPLLWPQFPGATHYRVYVWMFGLQRPREPTAIVNTRRYVPPVNYPSGSRLLWQIEYVNSQNTTIPSPIWGFETQPLPDLAVTNLQIPPVGFSGQQIDISWTVKNVGNRGVGAFVWNDHIFLEHSPTFTGRRRVASIGQRRFVDPQDGYTSQASFTLAPNDIGVFYIFVAVDGYSVINDNDRSNNIRSAISPVQINLTPPPNLIIEQIITPASTFSGQDIYIRWTVRNSGTGITPVSVWSDRIYLSLDEEFNSRSDRILGTYTRRETLGIGMSYSRREKVSIPNAIFGNYSIIVITDVFNQVYEHSSEDDNSRASKPPFYIVLSPPPDLVVSHIQVEDIYRSGDIMTITYTVKNVGAGQPFESYWIDQLMLINLVTKQEYLLGRIYHYESLHPGDAYSNVITYTIGLFLSSGLYNLIIHTDYANQIFEFDRDQNNIRWYEINIEERLPDLTVSKVSTKLESTSQGNIAHLNYTILNQGEGITLSSWLDRVGISFQQQYIVGATTFLERFIHTSGLTPQQSESQTLTIPIPKAFIGDVYLYIEVDFNGRIVEENELNNVQTDGPISLPPVFADLSLKNFSTDISSATTAGDPVALYWIVANEGTASIISESWVDAVFLEEVTESQGGGRSRTIKLVQIQQNRNLLPSGRYEESVNVHIPFELSGSYNLIVSTNDDKTIDENSAFSNNFGRISLVLNTPPTPDLRVTLVKYTYYDIDRILYIEWVVRNVGNTMKETLVWTDQIYIDTETTFDRQLAIRLGETEASVGVLESQSEYILSVSFTLPVSLEGDYYVFVETDSRNDVMEIYGEDNNIKSSESAVSVHLPPIPRLTIKIIDTSIPNNAQAGEDLQIDYEVSNIGDMSLNLAAWLDGVYLISSKSVDRSEIITSGLLLAQVLNNRELDKDEKYLTSVSVSVPHGINEPLFIAIVVDVNSKLEQLASELDGTYLVEFSQNPVLIEEGPLPDLKVRAGNTSQILVGGQPASIIYHVENVGKSQALGMWFEAVYLSEDAFLDPFDMRLKTVRNLMKLGTKQGYVQNVEVFIPFDISSANYYLFYEVDRANHIAEANLSNNIAQQIVMITETISTDLAVISVSAQPSNLNYSDTVTFEWRLRNLGTLEASGYKCDSVYLSEDDVWDVDDLQVGRTQCGNIDIQPFEGDRSHDVAVQQASSTPFVAQQNYTGIVRTRSNIRDPLLENNIGVASIPLSISATSLILGVPAVITLLPGEELVYRIDNVPSEETMIATLNTSEAIAYHDLFLRHKNPPTGFNFDATSKTALSYNQRAIVRHTRPGTYYLRIKSNGKGTDPYQVEILVKIARFEILQTSPAMGAPLGNVTIHFSGTVFAYNIQGQLMHENSRKVYKAMRTYWFNSEDVYATFNATELPEGIYSPQLQDMDTKIVSQMNSRFCIREGIPGRMTVDVKVPGPTRAGTNARIPIIIRNTGNTDITIPTLILGTGNESGIVGGSDRPVTVRRPPQLTPDPIRPTPMIPPPTPSEPTPSEPTPSEPTPSEPTPTEPEPEIPPPKSNQEERVPLPSMGPGGMLPPDGSVAQDETEVMGCAPMDEFNVCDSGNSIDTHGYEKSNFQPPDVPDIPFDIVWDNFMESVGPSWSSFNQRMSEVATEMSLAQQRMPCNTRDLVDFQLRIADGLLSGAHSNIDIFDMRDEDSSDFVYLTMRRKYSPFILKRRTSGPMGMGWILRHWEIRLKNISDSGMMLSRERTSTIFTSSDISGVYISVGGDTIASVDGGFLYEDPELNEIYKFDNETGKLVLIVSSLDDSNIVVEYANLDDEYPSLFKHSSGTNMNVTYTDQGRISAVDILDHNGNIQQSSFYKYDSTEHWLISVIVDNRTDIMSYNDGGDLVEISSSSGGKRIFQYNKHHHLVGYDSFNSDGEMVMGVSMTPDWNGNVMTTVQPRNKSMELKYDPNGQIVFLRQSDSLPLILAQSPSRKSLLLGDKELFTEVFDRKSNILHLTDANGNEIMYKYGNDDEVRSITDSSGYVYSVDYDEVGRVTGLTTPDGNKTTLNYNTANLLSSIVNPDGSSITYFFDSKPQLIQINIGDEQSTYEYDSKSYLTKSTNKEGSVEIVYDKAGRPSGIAYPNGHTLTFGYNGLNQRTYIADGNAYNISYHYDRRNRLSEIRQSASGEFVVRYHYSETNDLVRKSLSNGAYSTYKYENPTGRLSEVHNFLPGGEESDFFIYGYDKQGRMISLATKNGNWTYRYDPVNQLVRWVSPSGDVVEYTYDVRGNRLVEIINEQEKAYSVNSVNQYLKFSDTETFAYDANGHLMQKITGGRRERYTFSANGELIETESPNKRCSYHYDALGNLFKKNCSDSTSFEYLVDPYGRFGADIIAEISTNGTVYFVSSFDQGLVAALNSITKAFLYYEFDGIGSIVSIMDRNGEIQNSYRYDPFGRIIQQREQCRNIHKFSGIYGIIVNEELQDVYMMRNRHYDAQHGRFLSMDPIGLSGNNPNLYIFAFNSPLNIGDPTGQIPHVLLLGAGSAAINAIAYATVQYATGQEITLGGVAGAAVTGLLTSPGIIPGTGLLAEIGIQVVGNFIGQALGDALDHKHVDVGAAAINAAVGVAFGNRFRTPQKLLKYATRPFAKKVSASFAKSVTSLINRFAKKYNIDPEILRKIANKYFASVATAATGTGLTKFRNYLRWILSKDPNDMIGPEGFGDAHFIPRDLDLEYKIRFENDPNATAPAQRIFIRHKFDDDLDERTFRIGSFGFGDFSRDIPFMRSFVQDNIDTTESHGVFVKVRGGVDVVNREATWELQAIDPETGEPPVDPTVGFLPPNNGTDGQGFVTFTIRADDQVKSLARIDAEATIIFDQNEPIATPPIFNTIDGTNPILNLTVNETLLDAGTVAVDLCKSDIGSGVASVDIYELIGDTGMPMVQPLQLGVAKSGVVVLALSPGAQHRIFASAVDHVGNRQSIPEDMKNILIVDVPLLQRQCPNNCSLRGNCSSFGICSCETGYFGKDCSLGSPPMEPPILQLSSPGGIEGIPIIITLSASIPGDNESTIVDDLVIHITHFPEGSTFNRGKYNGKSWEINSTEFGEVELTLPPFFSGSVVLSILASNGQVSREGTLAFAVEAVANPTTLVVGETCYNQGLDHVNISISSALIDQDGSECLQVVIANVPDSATLSVGQRMENGEYMALPRDFQEVSIELSEEFEPFNITVSALSIEKLNFDTAYTNVSLLIDFCDTTDVDECKRGTNNCSQLCINTVGSYTCDCILGFQLDSDGRACNNVDECVIGAHKCTQVCVDTIGSYECNCFTGYELTANGNSCQEIDVDECELGTHNCTQICLNTNDSYVCSCNAGFTLDDDEQSCNDVDECELSRHSCNQLCINNNGSYECKCYPGYELDRNNVSCNNVDECTLNIHNCEQICKDTNGSYVCDCLTNYILHSNGHSCIPPPPFTLNFVNNSPRIKGNEVSVDFTSNRPLTSAACYLGRDLFVKDCTNGSVVFTDVPMGESYILRVAAWDTSFTRAVIRQQVNVFDTPFSLAFINDTPRIEGNNVSLAFVTSTPVSSAVCYLGRHIFKECDSGNVQFSQVASASYVLKVVANRPGKRIIERRVLHILGEGSLSCSVHMINEGLILEGRNASIYFTGTGPVQSYFCRMDDSTFHQCDSPARFFNLKEGTHTFKVKSQRCGEKDRRLSFKFKVE